MRGCRFGLACEQPAELGGVRVDVAVGVHGNEGGELHETRIDPAAGAGIARWHRRDCLALILRNALLLRERV